MAGTIDLLRARFSEATTERDAILEQTAPLRAQRDAILAKARKTELTAAPLEEQIRTLEGPLFDLQNELATIARALGGRTSSNASGEGEA